MSDVVSNISPPPGAVASISDASPIHCIVKIEQFSLLAKNAVEKYESGVFEAGGYKWKLVLYPNGNKRKNVKDYISLYLAIVEESSLPLGWEVHVIFRLVLLDQNKDSYLVIQEGKERRFHGLKLEWGFDQFIQLSTFNDARYGFLLEDTCVLGAEVFVCRERSRGKRQVFSMIKEPTTFKYTWKIENLSSLDEKRQESQTFSTASQKWKILLYPKGNDFAMGTNLSLYLALDLATLPAGRRLYVDYTLRTVYPALVGKAKHWFDASSSESGWTRFYSLDYIYASAIKDTLIIEAEVIVLGTGSAF